MTDFLSRLVDRVFGHAPVAQPIIAPHFAQGAEIFGPDEAPFVVAQTGSYRYEDERALDTVSSDAPLVTASRPASELSRSSENTAREVESGQQPAKTRSTHTYYSDIEEGLTLSPLPDRAAENPPAHITEREIELLWPTRASSPPIVSPATEQQPHRAEARELSTVIESLQSENEVKSEVQSKVSQFIKQPDEVKPADEMRKNMHLSEREQALVRSLKDSIRLENRSTEQQKTLNPHPGSVTPQIEKLSPETPSDSRAAKQRTSDRHDNNQKVKSEGDKQLPARQTDSVSGEGVIPAPTVPVEYSSGTARIVRPERVTARGRADSTFRAATADAKPSMQAAPTIKVTIGRIEVRAVLQPAPHAHETALPQPRMSLDDYLKSVSGERR